MKKSPPPSLEAPDPIEIEPHELFLPESEDDELIGPPRMVYISITRQRPWLENGGKVFAQAELPDADAVQSRFGGGTYVIQARDARKRVIARREITCHGKALPMNPPKVGDDQEDNDPRKLPIAAPVQPAGEANAFAEALKTVASTFTGALDKVMTMQGEQRTADRETYKAMTETMGNFYKSIADVYKQAPAAQPPTTGSDEFRAGMEYMQAQTEVMLEKIKGNREENGGDKPLGDEIKEIGAIVETIAKMSGKKEMTS